MFHLGTEKVILIPGGVISLNEFRYNPDLKIGDRVEVIVDVQEDKTGQLVLSHRKARTIKAWERVNEAHEKETIQMSPASPLLVRLQVYQILHPSQEEE